MTEDELRRLLEDNPDVALIAYNNGNPVRVRDATLPVSAPSGGADSTEGAKVGSQYTATQQSPLEAKFLQLWVMLGGPELEREYRFEPMRRWRADFAHLASRTLLEVEGGIEKGGRHNRANGFVLDAIKYNWATMRDWRVIRLTSAMLTPDYIESIIQWMEGKA